LKLNQDGQRRTAYDLLSYPDQSMETMSAIWPELWDHDPQVIKAVEIEAAYAVYLDRQATDIAQMQKDESRLMPDNFDYASLAGLSNELKGKLEKARPATIAQASRVDGMTPAAISLLLVRLKMAGMAA